VDANFALLTIRSDHGITEFYVDATFAIRPIDWQLELDQASLSFMWTPTLPDWQLDLDQGVTDFYVDANFAIRPIDWQLQLDQGITEFYVDATFAIGPIDWQFELDQGVTKFYVDANFAWLAIRLRPGERHWFSRGGQLCPQINRLAIRIRLGHHWESTGN